MGLPFYGLRKALDFASDPDIDKVFPERKQHKGMVAKLSFDMIHAFILRGPEYYADLKSIQKEFPFDIMIADIAFTGIAFVKDLMNIPVIGVSVFPLCETSKDLAPCGLAMTPSTSVVGKLKQSFLRFISSRVLFARPNKVMRKVFREYGIDSGDWSVFDLNIQKSSIVLQSGTPGFEYHRTDLSAHIHFAGPLLPKINHAKTPVWTDPRLGIYEKVVLITQGTVERDTSKLLVPTLEAFKDSDVLVIATTGGSGTKELRKRFPFRNIIIEDFIPFDEVMPYAHVYITNGGYGGVLLSIQNGLPMVVAGVHEGKNEINARIGYFELGINLKTETPQVDALKLAVEKVLSETRFRQNVLALAREFALYNPDSITAKHVAELVRPKQRIIAAKAMESAIY